MKALVIIGTRPEAIKLAPIVYKLNEQSGVEVVVCLTAQQREMVDQTLKVFDIVPDVDLDLMSANQTLTDIASKVIASIGDVIRSVNPDLILVQGDTTTAFCGALAGFYTKTKVGHIEAGLRTGDRFSPYPEEVNRSMVSNLADYHFAPTKRSKNNLLAEGVCKSDIYVCGNTVIDSLLLVREILTRKNYIPSHLKNKLDGKKQTILVTGHRRENIGDPVKEICGAIKDVALSREDVQFVYPVHMNPNIQNAVNEALTNIENVHLTDPLNYKDFVWLLNESTLVLTDSGGIQEEAPTFGKPVLVMRDTTERPEGIESGNALLVGHSRESIVYSINNLLDNPVEYRNMSEKANPYGDGDSATKIVDFLLAKIPANNRLDQKDAA